MFNYTIGTVGISDCSITQSCPTLCDPIDFSTRASLSFTVFQSVLKLMSIELVMLFNHLTLR